MRYSNREFIQSQNNIFGTHYIGTIIFDADDTLFEFSQPWMDVYNALYGDNITSDDLYDWDTSIIVKPECGVKIFDLLKHPGLFRYLKPTSGAVEVVTRLQERGFDIIIATDSPEGYAYCSGVESVGNPADDKRKCFQDYLPMIPKENIWIGKQKWRLHGDVIVDDKGETFKIFQAFGRNAVLIDQAHNRNIDTGWRAKNLFEAEKMIYEIFQLSPKDGIEQPHVR